MSATPSQAVDVQATPEYSTNDSPEPTDLPPLATALPHTARLTPGFDVDRLVADLERLGTAEWKQQQLYTESGLGAVANFDWKVLSLCSIGGDPTRTDPGGPGLEGFGYTERLQSTPYFAEILAGIPAPLRAVRLMSLGPGARTRIHHETKYGFPWGTLRLHIPITTSPGAILAFGDEVYQWQPGEFWFGNFCRSHMVRSSGPGNRVHMVIDTLVTPELVALFPADVRAILDRHEPLFARRTVPICSADLGEYRSTTFAMPASFANWEEADGEFLRPQPTVAASVDVRDSRLVLLVDDKPTFGLVHIGDGEFRFAGWSDERTVQLGPSGPAGGVTLRTRQGGVTRELTVAASRP
ncbi:hypothetical protein C6361_01875 [Plantactinospora sp. BC1]|uniref:aspartyl/asparaginyl beta-hydroxylase domain-containing protein n=1 Tax=Plantactinospora sp. BC1 TaxID=2108470 RepID=UPI000D152F87|nr:aspartyl/asparaginyl beta-hydroxylase domain-containing protein [Plantactinospora sp. BC1]AVT28455.1 hypothetical protein C6361_01875 [Plantactinospora sp. BC1]